MFAGHTQLYKMVLVCNTYVAARPKQMFNVNCFYSTPPTSVCGRCSHKANKRPSINCQTTAVHDILMTTNHHQYKNLNLSMGVCVCVCFLWLANGCYMGVDTPYSKNKAKLLFLLSPFFVLSACCHHCVYSLIHLIIT